ncbi:polysaccharide pyruvyl transferase family protein [Butyrivibrio sp. FCS014]|uniref:polysaccharide pyruvyl transferase family protein n=1 Tax=Butyrivibrio sp. FCS014 TaxID=1408304 RepID=UPI000465472E|nr:polysaccharide pyruvyl transferase family protein [Butyrivibrio sp. FCS014]
MKIVITNNSIMYNRGSEAVIKSITKICRFWHPEAQIVVVTGEYGEILKDVTDANKVVPKFDATGGLSFLVDEIKDADVILVTGADNYDYGGTNQHMSSVNDIIFEKANAKTILYDLSLNKNNMNEDIYEDISRFSLLTVRESITEKMLKGWFANDKVLYFPDPAFILPMEKCNLPFGFSEGNTIGINISNLIMGKRVGAPSEIVLDNYMEVIDYILKNTHYNVMIIQHILNNGFDLDAAKLIYQNYVTEKRVSILQSELLSSSQIKYIISKLYMLVTARTHASIAGYSTNVPTLVVGYSVKSSGIALDIFGENENYVCQVRELRNKKDLLEKFIYVLEKHDQIQRHLVNFMPSYKEKALDFGKVL